MWTPAHFGSSQGVGWAVRAACTVAIPRAAQCWAGAGVSGGPGFGSGCQDTTRPCLSIPGNLVSLKHPLPGPERKGRASLLAEQTVLNKLSSADRDVWAVQPHEEVWESSRPLVLRGEGFVCLHIRASQAPCWRGCQPAQPPCPPLVSHNCPQDSVPPPRLDALLVGITPEPAGEPGTRSQTLRITPQTSKDG